MEARILNTPLAIDVRGSSVRVVVAADKYTVANVSERMNDREEYAKIFAAAPRMLTMLQTLARMDTPTDDIDDDNEADDIMSELGDDRLCSDANAFYEMIREAREIVKLV